MSVYVPQLVPINLLFENSYSADPGDNVFLLFGEEDSATFTPRWFLMNDWFF